MLAIAATAACGGGGGATPDSVPADAPLPAWDRGLPDASALGVRRGLTPARGIIHLHSPYSHDACDGMPRDPLPDGAVNESCLADLRAALCTDRVDFAALTDHDGSMADESFATLFAMRGTDTAVTTMAGPIASQIHCDNGHTVTVTIGGENTLMPIMLDRHPTAATNQALHDIYNGDDAASAAAYRDAGGLVWMAHGEQHEVAELDAVGVDGMELYNLHANLDPNIRKQYLGLSESGAITAVANFADTQPGHPEPDLAFLAFFAPSQPALDRWTAELAEGKHVAASAGTDAHENAFPILLADGERGDSYRRMIRWFANFPLVADPHDPVQVKAAVKAGRMFVAFEAFGTPVGFDVHADLGGTTYEMGDTAPLGATLTVTTPTVLGLDPSLPAPDITPKIIRIDATGAHDVTGTTLDQPGAYRVEIWITPRHLGPYLHDLGPDSANLSVPWVYGNPIYVE